MPNKVSINGSYVIIETNGDSKNCSLSNTIYTSSSLFQESSMFVTTGSWQVVDQNKNVDFRNGIFTNNDLTSSLKIAIANTSSVASILWPGDTVNLAYSGSPVLYAQAVLNTVLMTYNLVSFN